MWNIDEQRRLLLFNKRQCVVRDGNHKSSIQLIRERTNQGCFCQRRPSSLIGNLATIHYASHTNLFLPKFQTIVRKLVQKKASNPIGTLAFVTHQGSDSDSSVCNQIKYLVAELVSNHFLNLQQLIPALERGNEDNRDQEHEYHRHA